MVVSDRFLVTGALGCIGAWTCRLLVEEEVPVTAFDLGSDPHRLRLIMRPQDLDRIDFVTGDITELDAVERALTEHEVTNVVHLAALQVPFCKADPPLGARVNVTGTVNVFEAARRLGLATTVAYASSAAVYDEHAEIAPRTLYGVYKVANEGTARIYWADAGVSSIGLRPFIVYGPGRDQGLTAGPTQAIEAAVRGEAFRIGFGGRTQFHYAPDVARAFIQAARTPAEGASTYNLGGPAASVADFVAEIRAALPDAEVDFDDAPLPFPEEIPKPWFDAPLTPLADGVRQTVELVRSVV
jgi:nucleoside-diphosphate-sugar epimerase